MLENKKFNIILSLILAVGLWVYVVGEVNPTSETSFKSVPITYTNVDVLAERGMAVYSSSADAIDLQVKGSRSDLAKLTADDIKVSADMGTAAKGENEIGIEVRVPDGIEVTKKSMNKIVVTVEDLVQKDVKVQIHYDGELKEDEEAETLELSHDKVTVSGAESLINSVTCARGTIKTSDIGETEKENQCILSPIGKDGNVIERVKVNPDSIKAVSIISKLKEVELKVPIVDNSDDDLKREIDKPASVVIRGRADVLKDIDSVTAEPVDITGQNNGAEVKIKVSLPEGIELSDNTPELIAKVKLEALEQKVFEFEKDEIALNGENPALKYSIDGDTAVTIVIKGRKDYIEKIEKEDIKLVVDVSTLGEGIGPAEITASCEKKHTGLSVSPEKVQIKVETREA